MSYHNTNPSAPAQSTSNAQGQAAPAGYHYMPDGSLMSDAEHASLYGAKKITSFNLDLNDIEEAGEDRAFTILGDKNAVFSLEIKNEDGYYYNFQTNKFQVAKTRLGNINMNRSSYSGVITFPAITDADHYDIYLTAGENTVHNNFVKAVFADGSLDINSSTGSNSKLIQKIIYQTLDVSITISNSSPAGTISSISLTDQVIKASRGKNVVSTPFEIKATFSSGAISIDRQPTFNDIMTFVSRTIGSAPVDIYRENIYPTATAAFTGDDVNGVITSGAIVEIDADVAGSVVIGDKITTTVMTDTVNGDFASGDEVAITMDSAVATKMAVGDQVTGNAALDAGIFTVASLDSTNVFSLNAECAIADGITLSFSSKINRDTTTVLNLDPAGEDKQFTMSQDIQFRDNAPLTFFNRRNYRWPINNIENLQTDMSVIANASNGFSSDVVIAEYLDETTVFEDELNEQTYENVKMPALDTLSVKPTLTRNGTTNVKTVVQTGNVIFDKQALLTFAGDAINIYAYTPFEIDILSGYDVEFSNLKVELNEITTLTNGAVSASTTMTVDSALGIAVETTQTVNGATTASTDVILDSVTGLGIGQSLYVGTGLVGTPTITAIDETTKTITLSAIQTFADGITLTFPNSIISGIGIDPAVVNPYVDTISTLDLTTSVAQTLEDNQTFTFTGAGNIATITGDIRINKVGNEDVTLWFDIDKFLTQH